MLRCRGSDKIGGSSSSRHRSIVQRSDYQEGTKPMILVSYRKDVSYGKKSNTANEMRHRREAVGNESILFPESYRYKCGDK